MAEYFIASTTNAGSDSQKSNDTNRGARSSFYFEVDMSPLHLKLQAEFARGQKKMEWMNSLKGPLEAPEISKVGEVCSSLWNRKGKRIRAQWVFWFGESLGIKESELQLYAWAVEAIHTATLLHDDVIDKASLRRGGPSANELFDNTLPVLSGDYFLSEAIFQLADRGHPVLVKLMCQSVKELTQGEVLQYEQRYRIPTGRDYFEKLNRLKTSSLLKWAAQVGPVLVEGKEDPRVTEFALSYGDLYQFTDDILDIRGSQTKESWQDLREGKVNEASFVLFDCFPYLKADCEEVFFSRKMDSISGQRIKKHALEPLYEKQIEAFLRLKKSECEKFAADISSLPLRATLQKLTQLTVERLF